MTIVFARRLDSPIILCIDSKCMFAFLFTFSSSVLGSAGDSAVCMHDPDASLLGTECESTFRQNHGVRISPFRCGTTCRTMTLPEFRESSCGFVFWQEVPLRWTFVALAEEEREERERELLLKKRECAWLLPILSGLALLFWQVFKCICPWRGRIGHVEMEAGSSSSQTTLREAVPFRNDPVLRLDQENGLAGLAKIGLAKVGLFLMVIWHGARLHHLLQLQLSNQRL